MRILLKIIVAPFVVVLTIIAPVLLFFFSYAKMILSLISGIAGLCAIVLLVTGHTMQGITITVAAFLISPVGIPAIAEWLIGKMYDFNYSLRDFITS